MEQEIYFDCYCISAHLPLSHCTKSLRFAGATLSGGGTSAAVSKTASAKRDDSTEDSE